MNQALRIAIFPVGDPDRGDLDALARDLAAAGFEAAVHDGKELPSDAYDSARDQFLAHALLDMARDGALSRCWPRSNSRQVGLLADDLTPVS